MTYTYARTVDLNFDDAVARVTTTLSNKGFGILTEIDVAATLKKKLDIDIPRYRILGACNPGAAYRALQVEPHIGAMLPCNVIVREIEGGRVEVAAVDPVASMAAVDNPALQGIAGEIRGLLQQAIDTV